MALKNTKEKAMAALRRTKDKVIDKTSDVLSAPKRAYYDSKSRGYDKKYKAYKRVNDLNASGIEGSEEDKRVRASMKSEQRKALKRSI